MMDASVPPPAAAQPRADCAFLLGIDAIKLVRFARHTKHVIAFWAPVQPFVWPFLSAARRASIECHTNTALELADWVTEHAFALCSMADRVVAEERVNARGAAPTAPR